MAGAAMMELSLECEVLVAGGGDVGFSAAVAAAQAGAKRILIDKCLEHWARGNAFSTIGAYRTVHRGICYLLPLVSKIDMEPYTEKDFSGDMKRLCAGRSDPELLRILVHDSSS